MAAWLFFVMLHFYWLAMLAKLLARLIAQCGRLC